MPKHALEGFLQRLLGKMAQRGTNPGSIALDDCANEAVAFSEGQAQARPVDAGHSAQLRHGGAFKAARKQHIGHAVKHVGANKLTRPPAPPLRPFARTGYHRRRTHSSSPLAVMSFAAAGVRCNAGPSQFIDLARPFLMGK